MYTYIYEVDDEFKGASELIRYFNVQADGFKKTGCYNLHCPGYVQVHPRFGPGGFFKNISVPGKVTYYTDVSVVQVFLSFFLFIIFFFFFIYETLLLPFCWID